MVSLAQSRYLHLVYDDVDLGRNCRSCDLLSSNDRPMHDAWVHRPFVEAQPNVVIHSVADRPERYAYPIGCFHEPQQWGGPPIRTWTPRGPDAGPLMYVPDTVMHDARQGRVLFIMDQSQESYSDTLLWDWFYDHAARHGIAPCQMLYLTADQFAESRHAAWADQRAVTQRMQVISTVFNQYTWPYDRMVGGDYGPSMDSVQQGWQATGIKAYNCLNREPRPHRRWFFARLLEEDLLRHGLVSMNGFDRLPDLPSGRSWSEHTVSAVLGSVPRVVDRSDFHNNMYHDVNESIYQQTLFSVITDTHIGDANMLIGEKQFKPIWCGHPFLLFGTAGTLACMRRMGYETFPMLWDESYDDMEDPEARMEAIIQQIHHAVSQPDPLAWISQALPALVHNHHRLRQSWEDGRDCRCILDILRGFMA